MERPILQDPLLSVAVIAYNQSRWIGDCLSGIEMQRTSFPMEVCIGDDGSSDGTSEICARYATRSNDRVFVNHQIRDRQDPRRADYESVFMPNAIQTLSSCRGRYVAVVEGDDLWTDPSKLEMQVRFLEDHPGYSMVIHNSTLSWDPPRSEQKLCVEPAVHPGYESDRDFSVLDWPRVPFPSCSVVVRREVVDTLVKTPLEFGPMWDSPLLFIAGSQGSIRYMARPMACYRIHSGGCWNGPLAGDRYEVILRLVARLLRYLPDMAPDVRKWLQTLFDYNYGCIASRSQSSRAFQELMSTTFPDGTDDLHLNAWLARSSAEAVLNGIETARRLRESTSFRLGNMVVELSKAPMRGLQWIQRAALG